MSWDVSLKDVNAGMPRTVQDMYAFKEQSLYLIKVCVDCATRTVLYYDMIRYAIEHDVLLS